MKSGKGFKNHSHSKNLNIQVPSKTLIIFRVIDAFANPLQAARQKPMIFACFAFNFSSELQWIWERDFCWIRSPHFAGTNTFGAASRQGTITSFKGTQLILFQKTQKAMKHQHAQLLPAANPGFESETSKHACQSKGCKWAQWKLAILFSFSHSTVQTLWYQPQQIPATVRPAVTLRQCQWAHY